MPNQLGSRRGRGIRLAMVLLVTTTALACVFGEEDRRASPRESTAGLVNVVSSLRKSGRRQDPTASPRVRMNTVTHTSRAAPGPWTAGTRWTWARLPFVGFEQTHHLLPVPVTSSSSRNVTSAASALTPPCPSSTTPPTFRFLGFVPSLPLFKDNQACFADHGGGGGGGGARTPVHHCPRIRPKET